MLKCCDTDGETETVPEFLAVVITIRALLLCALKDGVTIQKAKYLQFSRF